MNERVALPITADSIRELAAHCGFELAGVASASPHDDFSRFDAWRAQGFAGEMAYLTDHRGDLRADPRNLLSSARSIVCVGKLYNTREPRAEHISRYAWGEDYHEIVRKGLQFFADRLREAVDIPFEYRICVDTAPLLERSYARSAGLGWIGKNTCLINQASGSWFFLGEVLLSLELQPDAPPPDRCGTCTRCIDACPTAAIVPGAENDWIVDSRRCISYITVEKRGALSAAEAGMMGTHVFGCDICQDVCPWNTQAPVTNDSRFLPAVDQHDLMGFAALDQAGFRSLFRQSPVWRAKYQGFLRNVAVAMSHSGDNRMQEPLRLLAGHPDPVVAATASAALEKCLQRAELSSTHLA